MAAISQVARARAHLIDELRAGLRPPGAPIIVKEMAALLKLSPTPIREALARLAGEGLVTILEERNGFAVPRLGGSGLAECLELTQTLIAAAQAGSRPRRSPPDMPTTRDEDAVRSIEEVVAWSIDDCGNRQITRLISRLDVILAPYRRKEPDVVPHWAADLRCLIEGIGAGRADALRTYFDPRIERAPKMVDAVERHHHSSNIFQI